MPKIVDVTVVQDEHSETLAGAFEYKELWTPADITTALWLKADDATTLTLDGSNGVEQWRDKSGNLRHFSQATSADRPASGSETLNGKNVLTFAADHLISDHAAGEWTFLHDGSEYELFVVAKHGASANPDALFGVLGNTGASSNSRRGVSAYYDDRNAQSRDDRYVLLVSNGGSSFPSRVNVEHVTADNFAPANQFQIVGFYLDPDNATAADRSRARNAGGDLSGTNERTGTVSASAPNYSTLNIGALGQGDFPFTGGMAELAIIRRTEVEAARQQVEGYFAHEWGKTDDLEADHPYKVNPPLKD